MLHNKYLILLWVNFSMMLHLMCLLFSYACQNFCSTQSFQTNNFFLLNYNISYPKNWSSW